MTVKEFDKFNVSGHQYRLIDADKVGYMVTHETLIEADRNVVTQTYGEWKVVGYEPYNTRKVTLYVKEAE